MVVVVVCIHVFMSAFVCGSALCIIMWRYVCDGKLCVFNEYIYVRCIHVYGTMCLCTHVPSLEDGSGAGVYVHVCACMAVCMRVCACVCAWCKQATEKGNSNTVLAFITFAYLLSHRMFNQLFNFKLKFSCS